MCDLVARTGRLQQRYKDGSRLIAGYCVLTHALCIVSFEFMLWFCNVIPDRDYTASLYLIVFVSDSCFWFYERERERQIRTILLVSKMLTCLVFMTRHAVFKFSFRSEMVESF